MKNGDLLKGEIWLNDWSLLVPSMEQKQTDFDF